MKKFSLILVTLFLCTEIVSGQHFWDTMTSGSWTGSGTLLGSEAEFNMSWTWELENKFLKLEFQNKRTSSSGQELVLQSHAYYQPKSDSLFEGTWFDSRGVSFPVKGTLSNSTFTVHWGSPETERGKTIYVLVSQDKATVTDYILQGENYVKFGEASYQRSKLSNKD